ncbi:DUF6090 family protein [Mangrovivirga sp. M17]|uniref:DUF6090 family protein n=1 Tax=Mangrovivirga halotolerans TaxID=2993936 RepID=A0ABT3RWB1_9BACT|nr:DUF6090 family protein [Mangrovivirga halotolerans]MCX2745450.1 DUF6090 family protein [Mangrovivirga halotolerans]
MIKFFRKIRYSLLSESKFKKYLLYAIGEIFLVVIGILIAVAINNWNEEKKEAKLQIKILREISQNLGEDIVSLENDIRLNESGIKNIQIIEMAIESNDPLTDTLLRRFGRVTFNPTYTLKKSGYKNLSSIGFQIISEDSIRRSITNLYETQLTFLKEREETAEKATYEYLNTRYLEYFKEIKFDTSSGNHSPFKLYHPKNYKSLNNDPDFQRLLDYSKEIKYGNLYEIDMAMADIKANKNMIDEYLEKRDH